MSRDKATRPSGFEVRYRVDELMGPIYERLKALPPKYRHREALQATRAYYERRAVLTQPQASPVAGAAPVPHRQASPESAYEEGVAAVRGLGALVDAIPDAMLEGPPQTTH